MTTTKSKPLKTAAQKNAPKKPDTQGINYELLLKIHRDSDRECKWMSGQSIKENYAFRGAFIDSLQRKYGIPMICSDNQTHPIYSVVALEYVLENATLLHGTTYDESAKVRLAQIRSEEEAAVRAQLRSEFEAKLSANI